MTATVWALLGPHSRYLADPIHHMKWTITLARARLFLDQEGAERAAAMHDARVVLVEMKEIE